ncbi:zinc finger protein 184-like [Thrips palmi]|uniref:Zinc finger protein 184-like n=1 Tax=Thrips palmi TaxID=161013 RepID=A0A6P8YIU6_THRPL|nr:zinc finger protein 184-like [Thrips palmi]
MECGKGKGADFLPLQICDAPLASSGVLHGLLHALVVGWSCSSQAESLVHGSCGPAHHEDWETGPASVALFRCLILKSALLAGSVKAEDPESPETGGRDRGVDEDGHPGGEGSVKAEDPESPETGGRDRGVDEDGHPGGEGPVPAETPQLVISGSFSLAGPAGGAGHQRKHLAGQSKAGRLACGVCGKQWTNASDLKRHAKIHTGEKPYQCDECGKKFNYNGNLTKHKRIHSGVKPYECKVCEKKFRYLSALRKHESIH